MKNNIIKKLLFVIICVTAIMFYGCNDDKSSNEPNKLYVSVYDFTSTSPEYNLVVGEIQYKGSKEEITSDIDLKFPCRALKELSADISFDIAVDNSLVDQFNAKYGEVYEIMPDGVLEITNTNLHIKKGALISYDSVSVKMVDTSPLQGGKSYLAPLAITAIKGGESCVASPGRSIMYVVVNTSITYCEGATKADMTGTLAPSRDGWTAKLNSEPNFSGDPNVIFKDSGDEILMWSYDKFALTVDMNEQSTVTGFCFNVKNLFFRWVSAGVSISDDGTTFVDQGVAILKVPEDGWHYIKFYDPIPTRFIRLECLRTAFPRICLNQFNTYVK